MDDREQLATKQDLGDVEKGIKRDLADLEKRMAAEMKQGFAEMREFVTDTETKLLTAFYSFADADQKHLSQLDRAAASVGERLNTCERRIMDIEKRLNFPSA
jgi:hypothetical protein